MNDKYQTRNKRELCVDDDIYISYDVHITRSRFPFLRGTPTIVVIFFMRFCFVHFLNIAYKMRDSQSKTEMS